MSIWTEKGLDYLYPKGKGEYPEGFTPIEILKKEVLSLFSFRSVLDFGCGTGRLCQAFNPKHYLGCDINPKAIQEAAKQHPKYKFVTVNTSDKVVSYGKADLLFVYTVFLHLKDKEILDILNKTKIRYLLMIEILGREWRNNGVLPVYNRSRNNYIHILKRFNLIFEYRRPYQFYASNPVYKGKNTDISFLLWRKR